MKIIPWFSGHLSVKPACLTFITVSESVVNLKYTKKSILLKVLVRDEADRGTLGDVVRTGEIRRDLGDNTPCCGVGLARPRELGLGENALSGDIDVAARGDTVLRVLDRRRVEGVAETRRLGDNPKGRDGGY